MAAAETTATTASGIAAAAASAGWPPGIVITCAIVGGLVSVWLDQGTQISITAKWIAGAITHVFISSAAGVALSAAAITVLPGYPLLAPLALAPQWAWAGVIAALLHTFAPLAWSWTRRRAGDDKAKEGSNA